MIWFFWSMQFWIVSPIKMCVCFCFHFTIFFFKFKLSCCYMMKNVLHHLAPTHFLFLSRLLLLIVKFVRFFSLFQQEKRRSNFARFVIEICFRKTKKNGGGKLKQIWKPFFFLFCCCFIVLFWWDFRKKKPFFFFFVIGGGR